MALGLCLVGGAVPAWAQSASSSYAILIVGDESKAEAAKSEKTLISEIASGLESKNGTAYKFPKARSSRQVYSYHFNKEQEKRYCEKKLDILSEDILFVGIIEVQPDRYPKRIVYRLDRIVNPKRSANDVLTRIEELMTAEAAGTTAKAPAVAAPATTAATTAAPEATASTAKTATSSTAGAGSQATSADGTKAAAPAVKENSAQTAYERLGNSNVESNKVARQMPKNAEINITENATANYWRCQVGAFSSTENARECYMELRSKNHEGRVERVPVGDRYVYKVFVGTFGSREEAQPTLNRLKDDGFKGAYICAPSK